MNIVLVIMTFIMVLTISAMPKIVIFWSMSIVGLRGVLVAMLYKLVCPERTHQKRFLNMLYMLDRQGYILFGSA